jgi:hypothetical protein
MNNSRLGSYGILCKQSGIHTAACHLATRIQLLIEMPEFADSWHLGLNDFRATIPLFIDFPLIAFPVYAYDAAAFEAP